MAAAGRRHGLPIVTEVMHPDLVETVAGYADILQIGARNVQNYALLEAVGQVRKPVFLKRGMMTTIEEVLLAAEYILAGGNRQVMICERGIRTFETATRNTLDIAAVPVIKSQEPPAGDHRSQPCGGLPRVRAGAGHGGAGRWRGRNHGRDASGAAGGVQRRTPEPGFRAVRRR